jgi:hypothetical protein
MVRGGSSPLGSTWKAPEIGAFSCPHQIRIGEVAAASQRALSASDPWEDLVDFIQQANALLSRDRGLKQALVSRGAHKTECAREKIIPIATELVARAQRAGSLRADLDPLDLPLIDLMVSAIADMTREVSPELWQRALTIIIDGLATTRQTPTPCPASRLTATNSPPSPSPSTAAPDPAGRRSVLPARSAYQSESRAIRGHLNVEAAGAGPAASYVKRGPVAPYIGGWKPPPVPCWGTRRLVIPESWSIWDC